MFIVPPECPETHAGIDTGPAGVVLSFPFVSWEQDGVRDVERINQFSFYRLAAELKALGDFHGETPPSSIMFVLWNTERTVQKLLRGDLLPIGVSRPAVEALKTQLESLSAEHFTAENSAGEPEFHMPSDGDPLIPGWRFDTWRSAVKTFETVFSAEMAEATTYYIPKRGIYDTAALIDRADNSFPSDLLPFVVEKTRDDWRAAGRCLALNLCTAAGFHVVRAVEGTLESYYQKFTDQPGMTKAGWHDYLKDLEALPEGTMPMPDPKTLAGIRQMKDDYRNPVVHPRVVLTEADARVLFNNGESAIIGLAQGLKEAAAGSQGALALVNKETST